MPLTVALRTFGCKLNQTETESIADYFARAGARIIPWADAIGSPEANATDTPTHPNCRADVYLFNTCTVTTKAEQKARREMRQVGRINAEALILVSGCYAEMEPDAIADLAPRLLVLPGSRKSDISQLARALAEAHEDKLDLYEHAHGFLASLAGTRADPFALLPGSLHFHTRPSLKIQDGCDNRCSYCRVCLARGPSRSLPAAQIIERARQIALRGAQEIVLAGVNLSQYRDDDLDFSSLLALLLRETDEVAYRVSSWEPNKVDDSFLRVFAQRRVRPHLHLAMQSGSDAVLASMNRHYTATDALATIRNLREVKGDPFIAADMITGFPGETDALFEETLSFAAQADFAWIHAFTYSPRPGTPAFSMKNRVPERVAVERTAMLARLAREGKAAFIGRRIGSLSEAMLEIAEAPAAEVTVSGIPEVLDPPAMLRHAVTPDYLKLLVGGLPPDASGTVPVRITEAVSSRMPNAADAMAMRYPDNRT